MDYFFSVFQVLNFSFLWDSLIACFRFWGGFFPIFPMGGVGCLIYFMFYLCYLKYIFARRQREMKAFTRRQIKWINLYVIEYSDFKIKTEELPWNVMRDAYTEGGKCITPNYIYLNKFAAEEICPL